MHKPLWTLGWIAAVLWFHLLTAPPAVAEQAYLGLVTGNQGASGHQMGMDLKALLKRYGIHLAIFNSRGSVENIFAVYQRPGTHLGLVNADVLSFVAKVKSRPELERIASKVKWVYPLHRQEVHILAGPSIQRLSDLTGKQVAVGHVQSDSYLTGRLIMEIAGVRPARLVSLDEAQAIEALKAGHIDAMVMADGVPVERLALDISLTDRLHLVPINHEAVRRLYAGATIRAGTYPWQTADVETVAVQVVLVVYDFSGRHCRSVNNLARLLAEHIEWLQINGHPKWRSVNLDDRVTGWQRYPCVGPARPEMPVRSDPAQPDRKPNPVADAIEAMFSP